MKRVHQIAELVEDHAIGMDEAVGDLSGSALRLLLLERIDQFDGGEEADASAVVLDRMHADGGRDMGFSGAGPADQDDVIGVRTRAAQNRTLRPNES